jgi:hypothetical protein
MKVATKQGRFQPKVIPDVRTPHGRKRPLLLQLVFLSHRIGETPPLDYLSVTVENTQQAIRPTPAGGSE